MTDIDVYLEKLARFSDLLRADGLSVGLQETADAARTLTAIGFEDRELVKAALMTVYAKSRDEQKVFSRAFDSFFVTEEVMRKQVMEQTRQQQAYEEARARAEEELRQGFEPFSGDIRDNEGVVRCRAGEYISDETLRESIDWLVEGVSVYE